MDKTLTPGQILYSSWGYDQTNINYYEVIRATARYVWVIELRTERSEKLGAMCGTRMPLPGEYWPGKKALRRAIKYDYAGTPYVAITAHEWAKPWDGSPQHYTAYA